MTINSYMDLEKTRSVNISDLDDLTLPTVDFYSRKTLVSEEVGSSSRSSKITDRYDLEEPVSSSERAVVSPASERENGDKVMTKRFLIDQFYDKEKNVQDLLSKPGHDNLLLAEEFVAEDRTIISPYARGMDLNSLRKVFDKKYGLKKLFPSQTRVVARDLLSALQYMHDHGVVHCDVKGGNLLVDVFDPNLDAMGPLDFWLPAGDYNIKLFDFEISHIIDDDHGEHLGSVVGTPLYMPPETIRPLLQSTQKVTPAPTRDIYSAGVLLYNLLAGKCLFSSRDIVALANNILTEKVPDITLLNTSVDSKIKNVLEKSLEKNPYKRYQSAEEFKEAYLEATK